MLRRRVMPAISVHSPALLPWQGLLPREHGAYFQLGLPLATALAVTGATPAGLWLAGAAVAGFLAQEPLRVALGQRGARRATGDGARAWRWGALLAAVGLLCFGLGAASMEASARPYLALPLILGAEVALVVWNHQQRTASGEVLAALALGAWAVPVALAGGLEGQRALALWGTFGLTFGLATLAVHLLIVAHKPRSNRALLRLAGAGSVALVLGAAVAWSLSAGASLWGVAALLPAGLLGLGLCVALPSPRRLPAVGWSLAVASLLTAVLLGASLA
ncbi:YwiC-like family protein [Myxococcaceae bacterium GXIMD 01537]